MQDRVPAGLGPAAPVGTARDLDRRGPLRGRLAREPDVDVRMSFARGPPNQAATTPSAVSAMVEAWAEAPAGSDRVLPGRTPTGADVRPLLGPQALLQPADILARQRLEFEMEHRIGQSGDPCRPSAVVCVGRLDRAAEWCARHIEGEQPAQACRATVDPRWPEAIVPR
jgi:hypothetical protein